MHKVFVYGTLRKNQKSTHILDGYRLFDLGRFPCIIAEEGYFVHGNVIEVDDDHLRDLDYMEGTAHGFYTREVVSVRNNPKNKGKSYKEVFVYVAGNVLEYDVEPKPIPSGDWMVHPAKQANTFQPFR